jgi:fatty-acyl-CoA synthase/long-chain acyl-CoA synthetase
MIELTVARTLSLALQRGGHCPAIHFNGATITYAALDELANRVANTLLSLGLEKGDRVGVVLPNVPEYVAIAVACAKSALTMVTLNYRFTANEYVEQLENCGAKLLIYSDRFRDVVRDAGQHLPGLWRICLGQRSDGDLGAFHALIAQASPHAPEVSVSEHDIFYLGYTSGTTGRPKGAMVTHRNRALAYHYWALEFGIRGSDTMLHTGPFHHTAPFTFVLTQLFMGGQVVILDHFDPRLVAEAIEHHQVAWGFLVPYMLDRLIASADEVSRHNLSSLRFIISGASALPTRTKDDLLKLLPAVGLHEFYGATEAGVITNLRPEDQSRKIRCVGRPVFDTEIEIRDDNGDRIAPGEVGNIWMRGPTVFSGYYQAPDKNAEVFSGDWCTIGDVGRVDEDGYVYILDRRKDVIKSGGVNIFPLEIEEVLRVEPSVEDVAVIGVPDDVWGESVHAVIVLTNGAPIQEDALKAACRGKLAGYKVPKSFEVRSVLPRNANGKVLKRVLRQEFVDNGARQNDH